MSKKSIKSKNKLNKVQNKQHRVASSATPIRPPKRSLPLIGLYACLSKIVNYIAWCLCAKIVSDTQKIIAGNEIEINKVQNKQHRVASSATPIRPAKRSQPLIGLYACLSIREITALDVYTLDIYAL